MVRIFDEVEQGTAEWHAMRRGKITGTKLADVMGTSLDRVKLAAELIAQEGTEQTKQIRVTSEMERGSAEEPFAVQAYEAETKRKVDRVCFCVSDEFEWLGLSPDGLIKDGKKYTRAIEVKSPDSDTAVFYRLTNEVGMERLGLGTWSKPTKDNPEPVFKASSKEPFCGVPADYKWQVVQYFMVVDTLQTLDFLTYDPRFIDPSRRLYTVTVARDMPAMQAALKEAREELIRFRADWMAWKEIIMPDNF